MLLQKVLWKSRSRIQIMGASLGVFVGLFLLLFAIQFYLDMRVLMQGARDSNLLVINKELSVLNTLGVPSSFKDEEIQAIRDKPYIDDVGVFTSNRFRAAVEIPSFNFYTLLFVQTVPNQFLGIDTINFAWEKGQPVPIVISSDYLALYNFGFAPSQGLPQLTLSAMQLLTADLVVMGNGKREVFQAKIHDLSPNINSILVPKSFMDFANAEFGDQNKPVNQLVISTNNPYSKDLNSFLQENGYAISRGGLIGGELLAALDILVLAVLLIGLIIIGLSLLVFILNFQLLVAQASQDVKLLLQIGYHDYTITRTLARHLVVLFGFVVVATFVLLLPTKYVLTQLLIEQGYTQFSVWLHPYVWAVGAGFCAIFIWLNWRSIRRSVRKVA